MFGFELHSEAFNLVLVIIQFLMLIDNGQSVIRPFDTSESRFKVSHTFTRLNDQSIIQSHGKFDLSELDMRYHYRCRFLFVVSDFWFFVSLWELFCVRTRDKSNV